MRVGTFKNRAAVRAAGDMTAFLHIEMGVIRGAPPDHEKMLDMSRARLKRQSMKLSEKDGRIAAERAAAELDIKAEDYDGEMHSALRALMGDAPTGCARAKAYMLAAEIRRRNMKLTLDVAAASPHPGDSLLPKAFAHERYTGGTAYAVYPRPDAEGELEDDSGGNRQILRVSLAEAAAHFEAADMYFDMIHAHSEAAADDADGGAARAVELFLPRLRDGGAFVLDGVSSGAAEAAREELGSRARLVYERVDRDLYNDYAVFVNIGSPPEAGHGRRFRVEGFW